MTQKKSVTNKRLPTSFKIVVGLLLIITLVYGLWLFLLRNPNPQTVFWQTIDQNYKTKQINSQTTIYWVGEDSNTSLIESQLSMNLANPNQLSYQQRNLIYDERLFVDGDDSLPPQLWYEQQIINDDSTVYLQHDLNPNDNRQERQTLFNLPQYNPPLGDTWHQLEFDNLDSSLNLQLYMMTIYLTNGFNFGYFESHDRREIVDQLEGVYQLDFENVAQFNSQGRLYYEYRVGVDYDKLQDFLAHYFNLHINDDSDKFEEIPTVFNQSINYKITIDVLARRIVQVEYPLYAPVLPPYNFYPYNFVLEYQFSDLLRDVIEGDQLSQLQIITTIVSQDVKEPIAIPDEFKPLPTDVLYD